MPKKSKLQPYIHEARNAGRAKLTALPGLTYEVLHDNLVERHEVIVEGKVEKGGRGQSVTAAELYLFAFVNYICTHFPDMIEPMLTNPTYSLIKNVPWELFCNIILANTKGQKDIMQTEITKFSRSTPGRVINLKRGTVRTPLFVITLNKKDKATTPSELQRLAALDSFPINTVDVQFVRELFASVLDFGNDYTNLPVGWFAKIRQKAWAISDKTGVPVDTQAGTIEKVWTYLTDHDNGIGNVKYINLYDMLVYATMTTYLQYKKGRFYLKNDKDKNAYTFINNIIKALCELTHLYKDNLNFELLGFWINKSVFDIDKLHEAEKTTPPVVITRMIVDTMLAAYDGKIALEVKRNPKLLPKEETQKSKSKRKVPPSVEGECNDT